MKDPEEEPVNDLLPPKEMVRAPKPGAAPLLGPHAAAGAEQADRLRWAQKMEALGRLTGRVAHEINNQVTLILGRATLMLSRPEVPPALQHDLADVLKAAERVGGLMREWLTVSRKEPPAPHRVDLNALVADMVPMLDASLGQGIDLVAEYRASPALVVADRGQLEQVLLNLVLNARDAMSGRGRLTLTTANVRLDAAAARYPLPAAPGSYVMLIVRDTGCGMDRATQARIFEPYFTTKAPGKGTGMGLYNVYEILKEGGGTLQVGSTPGQGTTFAVYLPRPREGADAPAALPTPTPAPRADTALVLGDEEMVRRLIREVLTREGYAVLEADLGPEAVAFCAARTARAQMLVIDARHPEAAAAMTDRLRELYPGLRVLCTASGAPGEGADGGAPPGDALLLKPFTPQALMDKVRQLLRRPAQG
jgi:nitrogen-specific signal transduction histidine kinase/CheY-like chemotaxis protein